MNEPNRALIRQWVDELRSGRWQQCRGTLYGKGPNQRCAVGVLCHISRKELYWTELAANAGIALNRLSEVVEMNDALGRTFHEIADEIERRYLIPEAGR